MLNRYMLFAGENYYPLGGMNDYCGRFPTVEKCCINIGSIDWFHIYDSVNDIIIEPPHYSMSAHDIVEWAKQFDQPETA